MAVASTLPGSSLTWDRDSSSWRTCPTLFDSGFLTSSPTLPNSGSMRNGVCSPRPTLEPLTDGNGSGYWRTPQAAVIEAKSTVVKLSGRTPSDPQVGLADQAKMWPTPTASDHEGNGMRSGERSDEPKLAGATRMWATPMHRDSKGEGWDDTNLPNSVRMWATPTARDDNKSPEAHMAMKDRMNRNTVTSLQVQSKMWPTVEHGPLALMTPMGGSSGSPRADLNPRFVAALMGVPWDWLTPSTSVATDSFLAWLRLHSLDSPNASAASGPRFRPAPVPGQMTFDDLEVAR